MRRLTFSKRAGRDLETVREYIERHSPKAAERFNSRFATVCLRLLDFPGIGRIGLEPSTRELVTVRPYIIVYTVSDTAVKITSIWHGAQDRRSTSKDP